MKKASVEKGERGNLRVEYDLTQLEGGVRGKYYDRARAGTNLVLLEPEIARAFPNAESVNEALRLLMHAARASTGPKAKPSRSRRRRA